MKAEGKGNEEIVEGYDATVVLLAGTLTACGKTEIDVMEGLELNYNGVDGYGTASIADSYVWEDAAMEAAGIDEDKMTDDNIGDIFRGMAAIEEAVSYEVYPNENLSNGDEVTVKAMVDNESVEEYKIQFTGSEKKFTVEGRYAYSLWRHCCVRIPG